MNKKKALEILGGIKYPGFSRDVVSFGVVKDVEIEGNNAVISVNITTNDSKKKQEIFDSIKNAPTR